MTPPLFVFHCTALLLVCEVSASVAVGSISELVSSDNSSSATTGFTSHFPLLLALDFGAGGMGADGFDCLIFPVVGTSGASSESDRSHMSDRSPSDIALNMETTSFSKNLTVPFAFSFTMDCSLMT